MSVNHSINQKIKIRLLNDWVKSLIVISSEGEKVKVMADVPSLYCSSSDFGKGDANRKRNVLNKLQNMV